jgi:hypothetical protein
MPSCRMRSSIRSGIGSDGVWNDAGMVNLALEGGG